MKNKPSSAVTAADPAAPCSADDLSWPNEGFVPSSKLGDVTLPIIRGIHAPPLPTEEALLANPPPCCFTDPDAEVLLRRQSELAVLAAFMQPGQTWTMRSAAELKDQVLHCQTWAKEADVSRWQAQLALLYNYYNSFGNDWSATEELAWLTQLGIHWHGVVFMLKVHLPFYACYCQTPDPSKRSQEHDKWHFLWSSSGRYKTREVLRQAIALADDATYAEVLTLLTAWRATVTFKSIALYVPIDLCPSHAPWIAEGLVYPANGLFVLTQSVMTPEQSKQLFRLYWMRQDIGYISLRGLSSAIPLVVKLHGAGLALSLLEPALEHTKECRKQDMHTFIAWLLALKEPEQIGVLVRHMADEIEVRVGLERVAKRHPEAVLYTGLAYWAKHKYNALLHEFLSALVLQQPEAYRTVIPLLEPSVVEAFAASQHRDSTGPTAPLTAVPMWLQEPPWLHRPTKPRRKPTVLNLPMLPVTPHMHWEPSRLAEHHTFMNGHDWHTEKRQHDQIVQGMAATNGSPEKTLLRALCIRPESWDAILNGQAITSDDILPNTDPHPSYSKERRISFLFGVPVALRLHVWQHYPLELWHGSYWMSQGVRPLLIEHGTAVLPRAEQLLFSKEEYKTGLSFLMEVESAGIAQLALELLRSSKKMLADAQAWIRRYPRTSIVVALHQAACGSNKSSQDDGRFALQWLVTQGHTALIDEVAQAYGPEMVAYWVDFQAADPLFDLPTRIPSLPLFFLPNKCPPPELANGGGTLPESVIPHLGTMLAMGKALDRPYAGVMKLKEVCTPSSLAQFAWAVFSQWDQAECPAKDVWAFWALGWWGNDETVRRLTPRIKEWPSENRNARAMQGLDVLETIGSDLALVQLDMMANKLKLIALKAHAKEKMRAIGEKRHLTAQELSDRIVPRFDLDERGALQLDFGPRHFLVGFDETLQPFVRDAQGKRLKALPKPNASDNQAKAEAAAQRFKTIKKDVRTIAPAQIRRLEQAMALQRRWVATDFEAFFIKHPLMRFLAMRLVWGVYQEGVFVEGFRIAEDGSLADVNDAPYELANDAVVGIAHVLDMPPDIKAQFGQLLADYEIVQPFPQMGRETFALTAEEANADPLTRFAQKKVSNNEMRALFNQGWERAPYKGKGGSEMHMFKAANAELCAVLTVDPPMNDWNHWSEREYQTVTELHLYRATETAYHHVSHPWSALSPVAASEVLRDFELMHAH